MTDFRIYYKYAKYLLSLLLWARNRKVTQLYGVTDPFVAVDQRRAEFVSSLDRSHSYYCVFIITLFLFSLFFPLLLMGTFVSFYMGQ